MTTEYDIDVRNIDPTYKHTLARQSNREVDDGRELHLSEIEVSVRLKWRHPTGSGGGQGSQTFAVRFTVDHDAERVRTRSVGDAHSDRQSYGVGKLAAATAAAEQALGGFLADVDLNHYELAAGYDQFTDARSRSQSVAVHTSLEVNDDD